MEEGEPGTQLEESSLWGQQHLYNCYVIEQSAVSFGLQYHQKYLADPLCKLTTIYHGC